LPDYGKPVTIDNLVHHTSGIRDFWALYEAAGTRLDDGYTVDDILTLAARQRHLNFDPGAEYNYSNTGYVLLGVIVQRVTGKTLPYAFGLEVTNYRGLPLVEHGGSTGGYRTDITRFPTQHTSVVTMCNVSTADAATFAHRVADIVLGDRLTGPLASFQMRSGP